MDAGKENAVPQAGGGKQGRDQAADAKPGGRGDGDQDRGGGGERARVQGA